MNNTLLQTILSNLREIFAKAPNTYASYVAELTIKTIEKDAAKPAGNLLVAGGVTYRERRF